MGGLPGAEFSAADTASMRTPISPLQVGLLVGLDEQLMHQDDKGPSPSEVLESKPPATSWSLILSAIGHAIGILGSSLTWKAHAPAAEPTQPPTTRGIMRMSRTLSAAIKEHSTRIQTSLVTQDKVNRLGQYNFQVSSSRAPRSPFEGTTA
jgi:hypothetical protein